MIILEARPATCRPGETWEPTNGPCENSPQFHAQRLNELFAAGARNVRVAECLGHSVDLEAHNRHLIRERVGYSVFYFIALTID